MERTLIILKPDAVQRGLVGEIITRFEKKGIQIVGGKLMKISASLAEQHYSPHKGKPFYEGLVKFMTSSPVLVLALEGKDVIARSRTGTGKTLAFLLPCIERLIKESAFILRWFGHIMFL